MTGATVTGVLRSALLAAGLAAASLLPPLPAAAAAPEPPWLAYGAHNLIVEFEADPAAVRALLPAGLEPAGSTVHLNMYTVPAALGVPAYDRSYVWVDVVGHDAWDGTKGRYVLVGWAEPAGFREVATGELRWPAAPGRTRLAREGAWLQAELRVGDQLVVRARARSGAGDGGGDGDGGDGGGGGAAPTVATALLPYLFVDPAVRDRPATPAEVGVNRVAFAGKVRPLAAAELELGPAAPPALHGLRPPRRATAAIEVQDAAFVLGVRTAPGRP